jgi:tripartite-type tricarboxylate transporter receptor subunit TctC
MKMKLLAAIATVVVAFGPSAHAQRFPERPMTMVIPFAAGGPTDVLGRVIAGRMSEVLGQQVIVENNGGAGGMTGSARVAKAAPDGYEFVLGTVGTHAQGQTLYQHPLYNAPVILVAEVPMLPSVPGGWRQTMSIEREDQDQIQGHCH